MNNVTIITGYGCTTEYILHMSETETLQGCIVFSLSAGRFSQWFFPDIKLAQMASSVGVFVKAPVQTSEPHFPG